MTIGPSTALGRALATAVQHVRARVGSDSAPVVVITPSEANGEFARQQLALADNFIRIDFLTPERVIRALASRRLAHNGLRPEPSAWRSATIGALLHDLGQTGQLGAHAETLSQPGWTRALARATEMLETAGVEPDALEHLSGGPAHADRLRILAKLMRGIAQQRDVDRIYSSALLTRAALAGIDASPWKAAVVLGDRLLAPQVHEVLRTWFIEHPHIEVRVQPWHNLEPAPSGLRASLAANEPLDVGLADKPALGGLASALFGPPGQPIERDDSLVLARTPDEVRELGEATRVVIDAIRAGTPLDRIAVVLPDAEQVVVLQEHFDHLGIPATWLVGPPLATTPAARFLLSCLEIAAGEDTIPAWYELLRQPGLRLGAAIAADVARGRGRWRRILARCGAVRSTQMIVDAVESWMLTLDDNARDPEGDRQSAQNLVRAIMALEAVFHRFRRPSTLGAHAQRWAEHLVRWWTPSRDRALVHRQLRSWGHDGVGAAVSLDTALAELRNSLQASSALHGHLSDRAVRVLTPMGLLGGSFDVVVVTGLREGRLPRRPAEDPILSDDLIARINTDCGTRLLQSHELLDYETRRFAAVVSSCRQRLWLSSPATELLEARPLLPSSFLLEVASIVRGERATFTDLALLQEHVGSRARPWPDDPQRAVNALEHRIASIIADPRTGLRRLAADDTARRQLGLQRGLDQGTPTPWTGKLTPGIIDVPGLDGEPLEPGRLAKLITNPAAFLADEVLGIRRIPRLHGRSDPLRPEFQDRLLLAALSEALGAEGPLAPAFAAAWDASVAQWRRYRSDVDDDVIELLRAIAMQRFCKLERVGVLPRGVHERVQGRPVPQLSWVIDAQLGWREGVELVDMLTSKPARGQLARDAPQLVLAAMVQPAVSKLRAIDLDGAAEEGQRGAEAAVLARRLYSATFCTVHNGWWPWGASHPLRLSDEHDVGYHHGEDVPVPARRPS